MRRPLCILLASCLILGAGTKAAAAAPTLSGESSATAGVTFSGFWPLEVGNGRIRWDLASCTIQPKLMDNNGQVWRITDATSLLDSSLFRQEITVTAGPELVRSIELSCDDSGALSAQISLKNAYSGYQTALAFTIQWTARQGVTLPVTGQGDAQTISVEEDAIIEVDCKVVLNQFDTRVSAYPEQIPPLETDRWKGIPALEALHASDESS